MIILYKYLYPPEYRMKPVYIIWIVYLIWNLFVFLLYGADKRKAKKGKWRIQEKTLILCAFFFGGIGAFTGMEVFRHKTKHTVFNILIPVFAILGLAAIIYITYRMTNPQ